MGYLIPVTDFAYKGAESVSQLKLKGLLFQPLFGHRCLCDGVNKSAPTLRSLPLVYTVSHQTLVLITLV